MYVNYLHTCICGIMICNEPTYHIRNRSYSFRGISDGGKVSVEQGFLRENKTFAEYMNIP